MKNKYELITTIMSLCDENERLTAQVAELCDENEKLESKIKELSMSCNAPVMRNPTSEFEKRIFLVGKQKILNESVYSWHNVDASKDNEGTIKVESYDSWIKSTIHSIPEYVSKKEFIEYFSEDLHAIYEQSKKDALSRLEKGENK